MEKETKKWWLLATTNEMLHEVSDDFYNEFELVENTVPFWGTHTELVQHVMQSCFTKHECNLLRKGWQAEKKLKLVTEHDWKWEGTVEIQTGLPYNSMTRNEMSVKEWQNAPWLKHKVFVNLNEQEICLRLRRGYTPLGGKDCNLWTKKVKVVCLDQGGCVNRTMAKSVIATIAKFVVGLQSTIK